MTHNHSHPDRPHPTSTAPARDTIATVLDAATVYTDLAGLPEVSLIAHLGAYGLHLAGDGRPRTPAAAVLAVLDTASMLAHLLGLCEISLLLHLSACALRLGLHPRIRAAAACLAHIAARTARRAGRAVTRARAWMRNRLRRSR